MNTIIFDGVCHLCNRSVQIISKYDKESRLQFLSSQSDEGIHLIKKQGISNAIHSVVFINNGVVYYKSDAVIQIAKFLSGWPRLFQYGIVVPGFVRNFIYDLIAKHRYRIFGKRDQCILPQDKI